MPSRDSAKEGRSKTRSSSKRHFPACACMPNTSLNSASVSLGLDSSMCGIDSCRSPFLFKRIVCRNPAWQLKSKSKEPPFRADICSSAWVSSAGGSLQASKAEVCVGTEKNTKIVRKTAVMHGLILMMVDLFIVSVSCAGAGILGAKSASFASRKKRILVPRNVSCLNDAHCRVSSLWRIPTLPHLATFICRAVKLVPYSHKMHHF